MTWLSRIDKDNKEKRECEIVNLWLACHTQEEIAEEVGMTQQGVGLVLQQIAKFQFIVKLGQCSEIEDDKKRFEEIARLNREQAEHKFEFSIPLYNVWKQQEKTPGINHPGNTEVRFVDNLLYLYTNPFDIVIDPFAGSGSTADICKKRFRRYWVSDKTIEPEFEGKIRLHDIVKDGLPDLKGRWKDVHLVYLDPPYWKQAQGKYSKDETDFSNMSLQDFTKNLSEIILKFSKKMESGFITLIIQPTQWNAPEKQFTDHIADILRLIKLPIEMRISVPYESQQCNAQMVEWAKHKRAKLGSNEPKAKISKPLQIPEKSKPICNLKEIA